MGAEHGAWFWGEMLFLVDVADPETAKRPKEVRFDSTS